MTRFVAASILLLATSATAQSQQSYSSGLLCYYSITVSIHAWGELCAAERVDGISELAEIRDSIRADISRHEIWTDERIEGFEKQMGDVSLEDCQRTDFVPFAEAFLSNPEAMREVVEPLLNQSTPPEWGVCL